VPRRMLAAIALVAASQSLRAQTTATNTNHKLVEPRLVQSTDTAVSVPMQPKSPFAVRTPLADSPGRRRHTVIKGVVIGGSVGAIAGTALIAGLMTECDHCRGFGIKLRFVTAFATAGAAVGGVAGALIGAVWPRPEH
jgi:hypothetical protein